MKKMFNTLFLKKTLPNLINTKRIVVFLIFILSFSAGFSQTRTISGNVKDSSGEPMIGVTVLVKGTSSGIVTDINGNFTLAVPPGTKTLVFSFVGMQTQEVEITNQININVSLAEEAVGLEEVVVVGYGSQKKESMVGAIVHTTNEELKRTGGVVTLSDALTGQLAGVTTIKSTGMPGANDPQIIIRAVGTWNNSSPLILVDGIERSMSDLDVNEVQSISVLKDASATAVFGVKGAEGVILVTTKRGKLGKPQISFDFNTTMKSISRVPGKLDSYETLKLRNQALEYELQTRSDQWSFFTPPDLLAKYKKPQLGTTHGIPDAHIFPNVDWPNEMMNKFGYSYRANINITGGTDFAKYFGSLSYTHDGDLMNSGMENSKLYKSKYAYERLNYRTNMDFNVTKSTIFTVNISGYVGTAIDNYIQNNYGTESRQWAAFYGQSPMSMVPRFPDGAWGYNPLFGGDNVLSWLNNKGVEKVTRTQVSTDFSLKQKLDFITEGLSAEASVSYDSRFTTTGGVYDLKWSTGLNEYRRYYDPRLLDISAGTPIDNYIYGTTKDQGLEDFDFVLQPAYFVPENFGYSSAGLDYWNMPYPLPYRRAFYQFKLNYARNFGEHDITGLALMNREQYAEGSMFPRYREDWVGRITYGYGGRYLFETNGAYNGSEKFGQGYRFGFFPSVALGWVASNESFLDYDWLNKLKIRYSIGKVGNDNFAAPRWAYETNWAIDDRANFGNPANSSSYYLQYRQAVIGNPNLNWEASTKQNMGLEVAVLKSRIAVNLDIFTDHRTNIFMSASQRNIPNYFGDNPVSANIGETKTKGYELELKYQDMSKGNLHYWFSSAFTYAIDEVIFQEDPALLPQYQKNAGHQIGQIRSQLTSGYLQNWDDVYSSVAYATNGNFKLPGDYRMVDFNGDGKLDSFDSAPYGFPTRPQHTYTFSTGLNYKGFSAMVQFYGVYNVLRLVGNLNPFPGSLKGLAFEESTHFWTPDRMPDRDYGPTKGLRLMNTSPDGPQWLYDASYFRLKTAELSYSISKGWIERLKISSIRIFVNGNNLLFWSKLPDDLEGRTSDGRPAYPNYKLINYGLNVNF
jgi:TonB-linked SusC/RagA family outer membrane protein